jgi:hypothetical protein
VTWPTVLATFHLRGDEVGDRQVKCPFHKDRSASASVNLEKAVLHCFTCGEGWHLDKVEEQLRDDLTPLPLEAPEPLPSPPLPDMDWEAVAGALLQERGFDPANLPIAASADAGYLSFESNGQVVSRSLVDDDRPRYLNEGGDKALFFIGADDAERPVWIVEGIFDALALHELGVRPVAATLGAALSKPQAWQLRRRTVFVLYDADHAGWGGSRKAVEVLREFEANPIVVELPAAFGKDPGEAFQHHREEFADWLQSVRGEAGANDEAYVERLFGGEEPSLQVLSTGIETWDSHFGGGFKDGAHIVAAEPGVGKTSYALERAVEWGEDGKRVLYVTYGGPALPQRAGGGRVGHQQG